MGIKNLAKRAAGKAGDKVAKLSSLSPEQLREVDRQRQKYLTDMPSADDANATELTNRLIAAAGIEIYNAYLPQISSMYTPVVETAELNGEQFNARHNLRYIGITKWVTDPKEDDIVKLVNVYEVLSADSCNIALIFHRRCKSTSVYMAVVDPLNTRSNTDVDMYARRLEGALRGNFPGAEWSNGWTSGEIPCLSQTKDLSVATVSNIPTEKSEKFISQTIEKLLDGIIPKNKDEEYTLVLLATPVLDADERKLRLEQLYTGLAPYASWQTSYTYQESGSTSSSATVGLNAGVSVGRQVGNNQSLADGQSTSDSASSGITDTEGSSLTDTVSEGVSDSTGHTDGTNASINGSVSVNHSTTAGAGVGVPGGPNAHVDSTTGHSLTIGGSHGTSASDSTTHGTNSSIAQAVGQTTAKAVSSTLGRAVTRSLTNTVGSFASQSLGGNFGVNFARTSTVTATIGKNEGISQTHTNYSIKHTLELLEQQMKRYEQGTALGLWEFAAYALSNDPVIANNVAHSYLALTQGEESFMSQASVNLWRGDTSVDDGAATICEYLKDLRHPLFALNPNLVQRQPNVLPYPSTVTATTVLTGKELARSLNFPRKSVAGLPVFECASFGRNVATFEEPESTGSIELGKVFHMHRSEPMPVMLDLDSLAGHTFITGSTGAGKSNTVFRILEQTSQKDIGFLVVEPAKGEYKDAFGNDEDVNVFGTNPAYTPLLKLDPFSFPKGMHALEHLDRLIEIFNVCWPMYAAMPAVLKEAVEMSYRDCGWDLDSSTNQYGDDLFPCFADVARNVKETIDKSEYDAENKGAYKGSLLTRLNSLTNGINGMIFSCDEIDPGVLFDGKTIVDISRVGSTETKSLLMGILVLKLQEWRMSQGIPANSRLRHLTVLEEAHNLLRRSPAGQSIEGGNLAGKSVEMLANAIAEMRTYGEGFVIADQAPGLLDPAAIRNTNTKIVMRLPDGSDRELAGGSEALTDVQIKELARLPRGIAAVYQNNWIEAVLCRVAKARHGGDRYAYEPLESTTSNKESDAVLDIVAMLANGKAITNEAELADIRSKMQLCGLETSLQVAALHVLKDPPPEPRMTRISPIIARLFPEEREALIAAKERTDDPAEWTMAIRATLIKHEGIEIPSYLSYLITQGIIVDYIVRELNDQDSFNEWSARGALA